MKCSMSRPTLLLLAALSTGLGCGDENSPLAAGNSLATCGEPTSIIEGDFYIRSMADLRGFAPTDSECFRVEGNLHILTIDGLRDLALLAGLTEVSGRLSIGMNPDLKSLAALGSRRRVDGPLSLFNNPSLASLEGLHNVVHVGGVGVGSNDRLTSLDGLQNVVHVGGGVSVSHN